MGKSKQKTTKIDGQNQHRPETKNEKRLRMKRQEEAREVSINQFSWLFLVFSWKT